MSKLVIIPNTLESINDLVKKDIDGLILSIKKLSVNASFYVDVNELDNIIKVVKDNNKNIYISLNKNMFNSDLEYLKDTLIKLNNMDIDKILFYDLSVLSLVNKLNINKELVIYQDHLNNSIYSHNFYKKRNINSSFISSDITHKEINDIKNSSNMSIFMYVYGYIPMSNSKRYLVTNYLKHINKDVKDKYYYIKERDNYYMIVEDNDGTTVYSKDKLNLINEIDKIKNIDYYVINGFNLSDEEVNDMIDKFNNNYSDNADNYTGFLNVNTIYKVKNNE